MPDIASDLSGESPATRQFIWVMRIFCVIYLVGGLLFFFMSEELFYLINIGPKVFKILSEAPVPAEKFWLALAVSMMAMLCLLSFYSSTYPKAKSYVLIHMASKITSVAGFLYLLSRHQPYFAYLVGAVTDSMVILVVMFFFLRSSKERRGNANATG